MAGIGIIVLLLSAAVLATYWVPLLVLGAVGTVGVILLLIALNRKELPEKVKNGLLIAGMTMYLLTPAAVAFEFVRYIISMLIKHL